MIEKQKLTLDLIPSSSWFENSRSNISKKEWDIIRKEVYQKANYKCEICNNKDPKHPIECHEIFEYDDKNHLQRLVRLVALCKGCHQCCHWGLWQLKGKEPKLYKHIMKVNDWTKLEAQKHVKESFETWNQRSQIDWDLDLSILVDQYGLNMD